MSQQEIKKVVVVGAGYTGALAALQLQKLRSVSVTIIDPRDFLDHAVAGLRARIVPGFEEMAAIPYNFKDGVEHIKAKATAVSFEENSVTTSDGAVVKYDYLILAMGSRSSLPGKTTIEIDRAAYLAECQEVQRAVKEAKSIVIIGAGPIGIESAGEIVDVYGPGEKNITLVGSAEYLAQANATPKMQRGIQKLLDSGGVKTILGKRATIKGKEFGDERLHRNCEVVVGSEEIHADLAMVCIGVKLNSELLQGTDKVNEKGEIKVQPTLQVEGCENVFSCGDVCSRDERKMVFIGEFQAKLVVKNIQAHIRGRKLNVKDGAPKGSPMFVPFGAKKGVGQLPNGWVVGNFMTKMIKSKDLFTKPHWKSMGLKAPKVPVKSERKVSNI